MKKAEFIFVAILVIYLGISGIRTFNNDYQELQNDVVRIHILANSDSDEDQVLKLKVRDKVLEYTNGWVENCSNADEAEQIFLARIDEINSIAQNTVDECGYGYMTSSEVTHMKFDNRKYGNITMPEGTYKAVRITIGSAEGHNWWCVMYPPLCIPASCGELDINDYNRYFTDGEIDIIENCNKYTIKLRCAEIYNSICKEISKILT